MPAIYLEMRLITPLPPLLKLSWVCLTLCLVTSFVNVARAQGDSKLTGEIVVIVFDTNGLPVADVRVRQGNSTVGTTDREGVAIVRTRPGKISLSLQKDGLPSQQTPPIPVKAQDSLEILVLYTGRASTVVDVETSVGESLGTTTATTTGQIDGTITNEEGEPVVGAQVFVRGAPVRGRTDENGRFVLDKVPATTVQLTVIHPDYAPKNADGVVVTEDKTVLLNIQVLKAAGFSQEFIVTIPKLEGGAVFVLEERRESSSVADLLGADQIAKSGDSDAASALQRVTGITLVGGRFVYVRGLGERYSSTLLDGSTLPSPDPERRVVPLDLFPSTILGSIVVQKTYSPDLPGEFGGGAVNLRTKKVPDDLQINVSASVGYRTGTTFDTALGYEGGSTDFLGFGVGSRAPDDGLQAAFDAGRITRATANSGFTDEELAVFSRGLNNDFGLRPQEVAPNVGFSASIGGSFDIFKRKAGVLAGITYSNSWFAKESIFNQFTSSGSPEEDNLRLNDNLRVRLLDLENSINLGAIAIASFEVNESNRILLTSSLNRISENSARLQYGFTRENQTRLNRLRWIEQQLITAQLRGEHEELFGSDVEFDWRYMFSTAIRDEPDRREVAYIFEEQQDTSGSETFESGFYRLDTNDLLNQRFFSSLIDFNHDVGIDLTIPTKIFGEVESKIKSGLAGVIKNRSVDTRRLNYNEQDDQLRDDRLPPDQIFGDDTFTPVNGRPGFRLQEITQADDSYEAEQQLFAAYVSGDIGLLDNLRLLIGLRGEFSNQEVRTFEPGADVPNPEMAELQTLDLLPAATLTWEFAQDMQLRFAGSRTLSRPNFRELSPSVFRDLGGTVEFSGNPDLRRTVITNADIRFEWYPSPGESFSVSSFFKYFQNPVEQRAQEGPTTRFIPFNVAEAVNVGGEIETRTEFGWIADALSDLYFAGNLTLVFSEVRLPEDPEIRGTLTNAVRPLAQQSPWVINAQFGYDNPEIGLSTSILYNVFGPRIWAIGRNNLPDIYEQPFDQLDFIASWKINRVKLQFKARNLLDPISRATQESISEGVERPVFSFRRGRRFSLGVGLDLD